jgi:hypothetical protein
MLQINVPLTKAQLIKLIAAYYKQESADLSEDEFEGEGYGCCEDINLWFNDQLIDYISKVAKADREAELAEAELEQQMAAARCGEFKSEF